MARPKLLYVGDSLGVGTAPNLKGPFRVRPDVEVGRTSEEGAQIIRRRLRPGHDGVVFDLGTNDGSAKDLRRSLRQAVRAAGGRPVYAATVKGPRAKEKNRVLRRFAQRGDITLVDWASKAQTTDGIHASPQGYRKRGRMFASAIGSGSTPVATTASRRRRPRGGGGGGGSPQYRGGTGFDAFQGLIADVADEYGVLPRHLAGLIDIESGFDPNAGPSSAGAQGSTQFMPGTAPGYGVKFGDSPKAVRTQVEGAAKFLLEMGYKKGDRAAIALALAKYNAGPGNPGAAGSYPEDVLAASKQYQGRFGGIATGGGRGGGGGLPGVPIPTSRTVEEFDAKGFESAERMQRLAAFLGQQDGESTLDSLLSPKVKSPLGGDDGAYSTLFKAGLLSTEPVSQSDFTQTRTVSGERMIGGTRGGRGGGQAAGARGGAGDPVLADTAKRTASQMLELALRVDKKNRKGKLPYLWGGGHGLTPAQIGELVDCSGFVSQILGITPRVSGQYESWGKPGAGKFVTVYANDHHVLMSIRDPRSGKKRWFGTSRSNPGGGAGEIDQPSASYLGTFVARHPGRAGGRKRRR